MHRTSILAPVFAALATMIIGGTALAQSPDKESQSFIKTAIQGNIAEIDVGKLRREKR